jgi:hypothetical protein
MKLSDEPQSCLQFSLSHPMGEGRGEGSFIVGSAYPKVP